MVSEELYIRACSIVFYLFCRSRWRSTVLFVSSVEVAVAILLFDDSFQGVGEGGEEVEACDFFHLVDACCKLFENRNFGRVWHYECYCTGRVDKWG